MNRLLARRLGACALALLLASPLCAAVVRLGGTIARPLSPAVVVGAAPAAVIPILGLTQAASALIPTAALTALPAPSILPAAPAAVPTPTETTARALPAAARSEQPAASDETPSALEQLHAVTAAWDKPGVAADDAAAAPKPFPLGRRARVTAYFFDVDDNIFLGLPTKIIVFHEKTGAELPLSTEEFARVRGLIGHAGSAMEIGGRALDTGDFEFRSGPDGSFREFRDPPGGNNFIAGLKWVVENLPPDRWQGPSWKAFVLALGDPDTAAQVAIVTARAHRPSSFLEAFAYLHERGLITHLPPAENIRPVGDTANPTALKVAAVAGLLDRVQSTPFGSDAGTVLSPDGATRKILHSAGFSDDDENNFTKMVEGLAAAMKAAPGRWNKVKIVLFYTGKRGSSRKPGGYVLAPDGRLRRLTAAEKKEALTTRKGGRP